MKNDRIKKIESLLPKALCADRQAVRREIVRLKRFKTKILSDKNVKQKFIHNSRFTNTPTSRLITHYLILFLIMIIIIPVFGYGDWRHIVMPAITLGTALTAYTTRILRSAIIEILQSEYLITLRARKEV